MKKIILSLVLAASAFNGWLAASGGASLSTSELQVDDVEMVAEASEGRWDTLIKALKYGFEVVGAVDALASLYEYFTEEEELYWNFDHGTHNPYTGHGSKTYICTEKNNDSKCENKNSTWTIEY